MSLEINIPGKWYFYWLIPSLISIVMSLLMMGHISFSWKKDHTMLHFQKICLLFGFFDLIQDIGLVTDMWEGHCRLHSTLFLSGNLYKAFIAVGGIAAMFVVIIYHIIPTEKQLIQFSIFLFSLSSFILLILFATESSYELTCQNNARDHLINANGVSIKSQLIFGFTFCLFTGCCCLLMTYMSIRILYRFKSYTHFYTFRTVILLYILIFLFAILPGSVFLLYIVILHKQYQFILKLTGLSLCASGSLFSLSYFILVFSPKIKKLFHIRKFYDQNNQIMLSSSETNSSTSKYKGVKVDSLTRKILYYDDSQWIESSNDQYGFIYSDTFPSNSIDRPTSQQILPIQKESFHTNLISSLYDIRIETPQNE